MARKATETEKSNAVYVLRRYGWWQPERIAALLRVSQEEAERLVAEADRARPRMWNMRTVAESVLAFALKNGHWPTRQELLDGKDNDLPTSKTIWWYFTPEYEAGGWRQGPLVLGSMAVLQRYLIEGYFHHLTPQLILAIRNVTVRREAMQSYGIERLLRDGGATRVKGDKFGVLWRMPSDNETDPHAQWVEVKNSTPEPNGRRARYFLRVPPTVETPREAVAWSFDHEAANFAMAAES
jgi:hypothetical protein